MPPVLTRLAEREATIPNCEPSHQAIGRLGKRAAERQPATQILVQRIPGQVRSLVGHELRSRWRSWTVLVNNAVNRENGYLYFIDKEGDVARSPRGTRKQKAA